jgi:hypothetical protein
VCAGPLGFVIREWAGSEWETTWIGPGYFGVERAQIEERLQHLPGNQLAIVRYSPGHFPADEWVYNSADIDSSKVVWAADMDAAENQKLVKYYPDRQVWLVQPDAEPAKVTPYTGAAGNGSDGRPTLPLH